MTELDYKISIVERYLLVKGKRDSKGNPIRIIFKPQDNTQELIKLDLAFIHARKFFGL
jgi:hypothetical protein